MMDDKEVMEAIEKRQHECNASMVVSKGLPGIYCPIRFDGWTCWPDTPAGTVANTSCPSFIPGFVPTNLVFYECESDGSWKFVEEYNKTWVNYTTCIDAEDFLFRRKILIIQTVGYSISLVALLISLVLLFYFRSLRCARILIHMNLFASFAFNDLLWLMWYYLVTFNAGVEQENSAWCIILRIVLEACLISNYSWMLCEGLYLHTVLVWAFISQSRLLMWMMVIGWGIPILDTIIYVPLRLFLGTEKELANCWDNDSTYLIIQQIPVAIAVILNLLFLINIVRVVVIKLRRGPANNGAGSGASRSSIQALRATLLLVPLFGINYLLTPFHPGKGHPWEKAYEFMSAIITSFQGLCVAILFCFCNGEVQAQIKRNWTTLHFRPRANSCTVTTVSVRKFVRSTYHPANGEEKV